MISIISPITHHNSLVRLLSFSDSDRVDDLMDAMQDEKDIHDQISDAISRGHGDALEDVRESYFNIFNLSNHSTVYDDFNLFLPFNAPLDSPLI